MKCLPSVSFRNNDALALAPSDETRQSREAVPAAPSTCRRQPSLAGTEMLPSAPLSPAPFRGPPSGELGCSQHSLPAMVSRPSQRFVVKDGVGGAGDPGVAQLNGPAGRTSVCHPVLGKLELKVTGKGGRPVICVVQV